MVKKNPQLIPTPQTIQDETAINQPKNKSQILVSPWTPENYPTATTAQNLHI
jgi:hypothetical protein